MMDYKYTVARDSIVNSVSIKSEPYELLTYSTHALNLFT